MAGDPFADAKPESTSGEVDPFADGDNPEERQSGDYLPFVTLEQLNHHAVILEPVSFDPNADDPNNPGKTREEFRCRLVVLAGEPIDLEKTEKNDAGDYVKTGEIVTVGAGERAWPQEWGWFNVPQNRLIGLLKEVFDTATGQPKGKGFRWGTVRRFPHKRMPKHLQNATPDEIDAYIKDYFAARAAGKQATEIKPAWGLQTPTPEINKLASAWYQARRANAES